jgi:hypothetical protein
MGEPPPVISWPALLAPFHPPKWYRSAQNDTDVTENNAMLTFRLIRPNRRGYKEGMSLMNFVPDTITLKGPLSIPIHLLTEIERRMGTNPDTVGLKMICANLGVNFLNDVGLWMGRMGTLKRDGERWVMKPKPIPQRTLSAWLNGKEKMPIWRLAQAVTLLELIYLRLKTEAIGANLPKEDRVWLHLEIAAQWILRFNKKEELLPWLALLRRALDTRLKTDAGRSAHAAQLFTDYAGWLEQCQTLGRELI